MVNFGPLAAEVGPVVWSTPANFNGFRVLAPLLHGTLVVGVSQTAALNRGRHLYLAGRPSRWALARILALIDVFATLIWVHCNWSASDRKVFSQRRVADADWLKMALPWSCHGDLMTFDRRSWLTSSLPLFGKRAIRLELHTFKQHTFSPYTYTSVKLLKVKWKTKNGICKHHIKIFSVSFRRIKDASRQNSRSNLQLFSNINQAVAWFWLSSR